ncbi:TatD family hydrolase [Aquirufa sp. ROCK2-A2]
MIDTHAHLYDELFLPTIDQHILDIKSKGVQEVWLPNCDSESWGSLNQIAKAFPEFCKPMVGLHPTYVKEDYLIELKFVEDILKEQKVLAIGEIGLDYYWDTSFKVQQMDAFETQCHWALENHVWVDIHCRKAYADLLSTLKKKEFKNLTGIIHCFSGDEKEAMHLVDLGFKLGIGGVITYKNANLFNDIKNIPLESIVLETDAPYLTPVPHRGTPNTPAYIPLIAQKLADLHGIGMDLLIEKTNRNALKLKEFSSFQ